MRAALVLLLLLSASPAWAASTVLYLNGWDAAANGYQGPALFRGGVADTCSASTATTCPNAEATAFATAGGNRKSLRFDASQSASAKSFGRIPLGSAYANVWAGTWAEMIRAAEPKCVGGSKNGQACFDNGSCPSGYCEAQRRPILQFQNDAGARGCMVTAEAVCDKIDVFGNCAVGDQRLTLRVLHGGTQIGFAGECSASDTMEDTPCGADCTSVSTCLQGRPTETTTGFTTACVNDVTGATCASGTAADCHCINECDQRYTGESDCTPGNFAVFAGLANTEEFAVELRQENGDGSRPGDVTCTLYVGRFASGETQVFQRGRKTRREGICTGGTTLDDGGRQGMACGATSDCACNTLWPTYNAGTCAAGTCSTSNVIVPTRVVLGADDTNTQKVGVRVDNLIAGTDDPIKNWRVETLAASASVSSAWSPTGCPSGNYQCLTGAGTLANEPDGNTTHLERTGQDTTGDVFDFVDITVAGDEAPHAVAFSMLAQDRESAADRGAIVALEMSDGAGAASTGYDPSGYSCASEGVSCPGLDFTEFLDDGTSAPFELMPPKVRDTPVGLSSEWTDAKIDAVRGHLKKTGAKVGAGFSTTQAGVTFGVMEVLLATPDPVPPDELSDVNGDGLEYVGFIGDSTWNEPTMSECLVANLVEPDGIYEQARGGASLGDVVADGPTLWSGGSVSFGMGTAILLGDPSKKVDVSLVNMGINTIHLVSAADPANPTGWAGLNQAGYCEDWTSGGGYGAAQGTPCHCDENINFTTTGRAFTFHGHCLIKNAAKFGVATTTPFFSCTCAADAECSVGGLAPPGTVTTTTCSSGQCVTSKTSLVANAAANVRSSWAPPSCKNAPGCPGVCIHGNSTARMLRAIRDVDAAAAVHAATPVMVYVTTPTAPGQTAPGSSAKTGWYETKPGVDAWRAALLAWAKGNGKNFIDLYGYFVRDCGDNYPAAQNAVASKCAKADGVHWPPFAAELSCLAMTECLTNAKGTQDGVCNLTPTCSGGTCQSGMQNGMACVVNSDCGYCTSGKIGDRCKQAEDCSYYKCVFP